MNAGLPAALPIESKRVLLEGAFLEKTMVAFHKKSKTCLSGVEYNTAGMAFDSTELFASKPTLMKTKI